MTESVIDSVTRFSLTDSVTRHRRCAKAKVCVIVRMNLIWNTLIAIFAAEQQLCSPYRYIMYIRK